MKRSFRVAVAVATLAALLASSAPAIAAPPEASPETVFAEGFEGAVPARVTVDKLDNISPLPPVYAWWYPTSSIAHSGSRSFWAAGMTTSSTPAPFPTPLPGSRGQVKIALPETADMYSAKLGLWYWLPTLGDVDLENNAFQVFWYRAALGDGGGVAIKTTTPATVASSSFVNRTFDIGPALAGSGGTAVVHWIDFSDTSSKAPIIDDVSLTGYTFGPVRNLKAVASADQTVLTWDKPYKSVRQAGTVDARPMGFRVWRSISGADYWTELTTTRIAGTTFTDTTMANGIKYDYAVQAWDPATGSQRGEVGAYASATGISSIAPPTPATLSLSSLGTTQYTWRALTVSGLLGPQHAAGTNAVRVVAQKLSGTTWVDTITRDVAVTDSGTGSAYSTSLTLPSAGTWRIRVLHQDADHNASATSATMTVKSTVVMSKPPTKPSKLGRYKRYYSVGYIQPKHTSTGSVKVQAYLYSSSTRKYTLKKTFSAKLTSYNSTTSKYTATISLPTKGTWKLRAYHPGHTGQSTTYTSFTSTFRVY